MAGGEWVTLVDTRIKRPYVGRRLLNRRKLPPLSTLPPPYRPRAFIGATIVRDVHARRRDADGNLSTRAAAGRLPPPVGARQFYNRMEPPTSQSNDDKQEAAFIDFDDSNGGRSLRSTYNFSNGAQ